MLLQSTSETISHTYVDHGPTWIGNDVDVVGVVLFHIPVSGHFDWNGRRNTLS